MWRWPKLSAKDVRLMVILALPVPGTCAATIRHGPGMGYCRVVNASLAEDRRIPGPKGGTMDDFLRSLRGEGRVDSQGQFTLDWGQGLAKLRAFQLTDPDAWVLKVTQASVAAGCTRMEV